MFRIINLIAISALIFVASVAPYASARGAALAFAQNPEECESFSSSGVYEENLHPSESKIFLLKPTVHDISFPVYIAMRPQFIVSDIIKPPSL